MHEPTFNRVRIGGLVTAVVSRRQLADEMVRRYEENQVRRGDKLTLPQLVFSSNGQGIALAGRSEEFRSLMEEADIVHADGMPVVLASKFTRSPLPERVATTDFFHDAARAAQEAGMSFYFLGATEAQNVQAVAAVRAMYPSLRIAGQHHGYFSPDEDAGVCEELRKSQADVVWVALGKPRQERWGVENRSRLEGVTWVKTCGGLYSFLAGSSPRAPRLMQNLGLEWLYRASKDPLRLGWRYMTTNPYAAYRIATQTDFSRRAGTSRA